MAGDYRDFIDQNVRVTILKALAAEVSVTLNDALLQAVLKSYGHDKTRDYVRNQLSWLEDEVGAITTSVVGTAMIATLTQAGLDHVERRRVLTGIQRPSLAG